MPRRAHTAARAIRYHAATIDFSQPPRLIEYRDYDIHDTPHITLFIDDIYPAAAAVINPVENIDAATDAERLFYFHAIIIIESSAAAATPFIAILSRCRRRRFITPNVTITPDDERIDFNAVTMTQRAQTTITITIIR